MALFEIPKNIRKEANTQSIKLKKGQTLETLILSARQIVEEKLGKYKDTSKCVTNVDDLKEFFNEVADNSIIALDTETTRFKYFYR